MLPTPLEVQICVHGDVKVVRLPGMLIVDSFMRLVLNFFLESTRRYEARSYDAHIVNVNKCERLHVSSQGIRKY